MRRSWIFWLLLVLFLLLVATRFGEVKSLPLTLSQGKWQWVLAAVSLTVLYNLERVLLFMASFSIVEVRRSFGELLPISFAALFVNTVVPSAGASGAALFANEAARRGESPARAAAGALLFMVTDYAAFLLVLAAGFSALLLRNRLQAYQVIVAVIFLAIVSGMSILLLLGEWQPGRLRRFLYWVQASASRLASLVKRPQPLGERWPEETAGELRQVSLSIAGHPGRVALALAIAFGMHLTNLAILGTLFLALRQPFNPGMLAAGYATGMLFWIVAITPQGIGAVEGAMAYAYTSLGAPAGLAALITLTFRGLIFWIPAAAGFFLLRRTLHGKKEASIPQR